MMSSTSDDFSRLRMEDLVSPATWLSTGDQANELRISVPLGIPNVALYSILYSYSA